MSPEETALLLDYARLVRLEQAWKDVAPLLVRSVGNYRVMVPGANGYNKDTPVEDLLKEKGLVPK